RMYCSLLLHHPPPAFVSTAPSTVAIHTLSLHDALPLSHVAGRRDHGPVVGAEGGPGDVEGHANSRLRQLLSEGAAKSARGTSSRDRKSTRLNSSHVKPRMPSSA